jgi:hypothetical protein
MRFAWLVAASTAFSSLALAQTVTPKLPVRPPPMAVAPKIPVLKPVQTTVKPPEMPDKVTFKLTPLTVEERTSVLRSLETTTAATTVTTTILTPEKRVDRNDQATAVSVAVAGRAFQMAHDGALNMWVDAPPDKLLVFVCSVGTQGATGKFDVMLSGLGFQSQLSVPTTPAGEVQRVTFAFMTPSTPNTTLAVMLKQSAGQVTRWHWFGCEIIRP